MIKGFDNQTQVSKYVFLIIKSLATQAQKLHNQINQYPKKSLICYPPPYKKPKILNPHTVLYWRGSSGGGGNSLVGSETSRDTQVSNSTLSTSGLIQVLLVHWCTDTREEVSDVLLLVFTPLFFPVNSPTTLHVIGEDREREFPTTQI